MPDAYPDNLAVRPLTTWPGELAAERDRRDAPFRAPLTSTLRTLSRELMHLDCYHPVLEVAVPHGQWRKDGRPRADARADHPGVVLSLPRTSYGPLRYATDTFTYWQDNLRAIALSLEALRRVDRYGVVRRGEQYRGFLALPAEASPAETAMQVLLRYAGEGADPSNLPRLWDRARLRAHPDSGGSREAWDEVQDAGFQLGLT